MSTLEATLSMLESMPEEARLLVFQYTQKLFNAEKPANPFMKKSAEAILSDLSESREQIAHGEGEPIKTALDQMGKRHGFV